MPTPAATPAATPDATPEATSAATSEAAPAAAPGTPPVTASAPGTAAPPASAASGAADAPGWLRTNLANWEGRVPVHASSDFYDLPGFRAGRSTLPPEHLAEVGEVSGRRLLHLQCHMGQDTLSWARLGARVTGLDFSPSAIGTARSLAADLGLPEDRARFVVSDVYDAPAALDGERFDVVYTGAGALVWLPDLTRWARVVAELLAPGGLLHLWEFHPLTDSLADDGRTLAHDYFDTTGRTFDFPHTYTDGPPLTHTVTVQWQHPLGEVITSLATAGLHILSLTESPTIPYARYPVLTPTPSGYTFPPAHPSVPLTYTLLATKLPS
jgi:SAM-dependent methyltransferase